MKMAEKLLMESHKMRHYEAQFTNVQLTQNKNLNLATKCTTRQGRMSLIKDVRELVETYEQNCNEVEISDTMNYIKKIITSTDEKLALISCNHNNPFDFTNSIKPVSISLNELTNIQETFRKTPFNLEWEVAKIVDLVKLAQQFVKKLRTLKDDFISINFNELVQEYEKISVKINEFEEIIKKAKQERDSTQQCYSEIENFSLKEIIETRQTLNLHRYYKDQQLDNLLLNKEVELLRNQYEITLNSCDDNQNSVNFFQEKPLFDLVSFNALFKEFQESKDALLKINTTSKSEKMTENLKFMQKIVDDVQNYLEEKVYSANLEELSDIGTNYYKCFIDLTSEIMDHKIKLEILSKEKMLNRTKTEQDDSDKKYDTFGLFGGETNIESSQKNIQEKIYNPNILKEQDNKAYILQAEPITMISEYQNVISKKSPEKNYMENSKLENEAKITQDLSTGIYLVNNTNE